MGFIGDIKDVASIVQKADNIELYAKILDIQSQAMDMQEEIRKLKEENAELKKAKDLEAYIERHQKPFITFSNDQNQIKYCAVCWETQNQRISLDIENGSGYQTNKCNLCKNTFFTD